MDTFGASITFDQRLYAADCICSMAYCRAICKSGIITGDESVRIIGGLETILSEWNDKRFVVTSDDEDIHSANERRLGELIGSIAGKLHTGRSRNDQVTTDMRFWLRNEADVIQKSLSELISVVVCRAETEVDVIMPGYTHLQVKYENFITPTQGRFKIFSKFAKTFSLRPAPTVRNTKMQFFPFRSRNPSDGPTFYCHMHGHGMQTPND